MGEDKALLPFDNFNTLTEFQLNKLNKIFKTVYISCKDKNKFCFKANFIEDVKTDNVYAPTAGFVSIYKTLKCNSFFAISVDSPFIDENIIIKLNEEVDNNLDAIIAKTSSAIQPMCGIYFKSLESKFIDMLKTDNHKLGFLLKNSKTKYIDFEDEKAFLNLNNPHEYKEALKLL